MKQDSLRSLLLVIPAVAAGCWRDTPPPVHANPATSPTKHVHAPVCRLGPLEQSKALGRAQNAAADSTIAGYVYDRATGEPVAGAAIVLDGDGARTLTYDDGSYALAGVASGTHKLEYFSGIEIYVRNDVAVDASLVAIDAGIANNQQSGDTITLDGPAQTCEPVTSN